MINTLTVGEKQIEIEWEESCGIIQAIKEADSLEGIANNIGGEVFFYQYDLDIPFNGEEREVFDAGDVVYWKSATDKTKFGILFMYGNTTYGDGTKPRTSSPGIKIGTVKDLAALASIETGASMQLG